MNKVDNSSKLQCGMYQDVVRCPENFELRLESPKNITKERHIYYCVPIPGETEWARKAFARGKETSDSEAQVSERRNPVIKRVLEEDMDDENTPASQRGWQVPNVASSDDDVKRSKSSEISGGSNVPSHPLNTDLNFPLPNEHGPACLVHVYDQESTLKVNDMVEFIGVLSVDPCLALFNDDDMGDGDEQVPLGPTHDDLITPEEQAVHHPPPSLVPRLHVVASCNLVHSNPCIPSGITGQPSMANLQQLADVRGEVVSLLTQVMCGDSLAAEYLLLHLISSVYSWTGIMPVGKFTLNVSGCRSSDSFPKEMHKLVEHLVPKCHFLPMTLNNMNTLNFVPKKDYTANRLKSSILQLSQSTNLIVDETALQAGQLNANGVKNVTALGNVISWQKLEYDFNFYKADFTTNLLILILSEGKSLLPADCHVALRPHQSPQPVEKVLSRSSSATIQHMRAFLGVARLAEYSLSSEMQKILQDDFVKSRQENQSSMTPEDFHLLLLLSRLMSLSHGQSTLTPEMWNQVKQMEKDRRARLIC